MKVLITGATGVIGSRVVRLALEACHEVTAAARSAHGRESLRRAGATPVELDLFDVESLRRAMAGHDAVINLATHIPSSSTKMMIRWAWRTNDRIRREASAAIARAASAEGVRRMIQESFAPMYPDHGDEWIDESMPVEPASYNKSALDAERSANEFTERGGTGVVVRFGALYGPDALMAEMLGLMRKGWAPFPGDPRAFVSSVAQDDAARAVLAALDVPAGIYNIVDDEPMRRGDWAASLAQAASIPTPRPLPMWMARVGSVLRLLARSQRISNQKFRRASTWVPRYRRASDAWGDVLRALPKRDDAAAA